MQGDNRNFFRTWGIITPIPTARKRSQRETALTVEVTCVPSYPKLNFQASVNLAWLIKNENDSKNRGKTKENEHKLVSHSREFEILEFEIRKFNCTGDIYC